MQLFALSESGDLARRIAASAGLEQAPLEERRFEGGEFKLRPLVSVRDREVCIVQCLAGTPEAPVADRLVRLLFLLYGLRDAGAARCVVLAPYVAYARKDRRTQPRDPVNTRYFAQLIEAAGACRLIALDVHNPAALDNAFRIPVDHLSATPMFVEHIAAGAGDARFVVLSPDVGGIKRAQIFRERLERRLGREIEIAYIGKRRVGDAVTGDTLVGDVAGRSVVILDDLCASGGTLARAAEICAVAGASVVHAVVTHAPYRAGIEKLWATPAIASVIMTDSAAQPWHLEVSAAGDKVVLIETAPLFAAALCRMASGEPLAPLLEAWPPASRRAAPA